MKKSIFLATSPHFLLNIIFPFLVISHCNFSFAQGVWTQKADIPVTIPRYGAVGFAIGVKGFVGTMQDFGGGNYDFWEWNPQSNMWMQKKSFTNMGVSYAASFSIDSLGYVINGNDTWEYSSTTNIWTQKSNFPGVARVRASSFTIDSLGYIGLGIGSGYPVDFWQYSTKTNTWKQLTNFPGCSRYGATGIRIGSKGYIFCGWDTCSKLYTSEVWEYNPSTDMWAQKSNFPSTPRELLSGFSISGKGYLGTGYTGMVPLAAKDFWEYIPSMDNWTQMADFAGGYRSAAVGFSIGNFGYISTGDDGSTGTWDLWEFDPDPNAIEELPASPEVNLFPNPFSYAASIETSTSGKDIIDEIEIFSSDGKNATSNFLFERNAKRNTVFIKNNNANKGIFFYRIKTDTTELTGKFIVQ